MINERKKGAILSYIQVVLSVVVSVVYVPVLLRHLGQSEYGLYQIVGSFFSYISVFESCMSTGVLRNYCNALGCKNTENADVTLSMARVIYWTTGTTGRFRNFSFIICKYDDNFVRIGLFDYFDRV